MVIHHRINDLKEFGRSKKVNFGRTLSRIEKTTSVTTDYAGCTIGKEFNVFKWYLSKSMMCGSHFLVGILIIEKGGSPTFHLN